MAKKKIAKKRAKKKAARKPTATKKSIASPERRNKGGRPTIFSRELCDEIIERMVSGDDGRGESLRSICRDPRMPGFATIMRWLAEAEESEEKRLFREQYERARAVQAELRFEMALEEAMRAPMLVMAEADDSRKANAVVNAQRLLVDTIKWATGKMLPKKYGDLLKLDHSGKVDSETTLIIKDLTGAGAGGDDE